MEKINFINGQSPYISATNLNNLQNNVENAINGIIESGSNANGNYIKYADGTLIQYGNVSLTTSDNRSAGGLTYYSTSTTINFPISFKDSSYSAFSNVLLANMNYFCNSYMASNDASTCNLAFVSTANNETRGIHWMAIGKWK